MWAPTVTGGSGDLSFALAGSLPPGLSFSSTTGAITGTPSATGTATGLTITVTDATSSASLVRSLTVAAVLGPTSASYLAGAAAGSDVATISGLAPGETVTAVDDSRLAVGGSGTKLVKGLATSVAGTFSALLTTTSARTLSIALTVTADEAPWEITDLPASALAAYWDVTQGLTLNGGNVSAWADRKAGLVASQAAAARQPPYSANGLNGHPCIQPSGDRMLVASLANASDKLGIHCVVSLVSPQAGDYRRLFSLPNSGGNDYDNNNAIAVYKSASGNVSVYRNAVFDVATPVTSASILSIIFDGTAVTGFVDGVQVSSSASSGVFGYVAAKLFDNYAASGGNSQGVDGTFGDIVFTQNENISVDDRRKIEGKLAHKFGLQGNLALGHPWKNTPPTKSASLGTIASVNGANLALWFDNTDTSTLFQDVAGNTPIVPNGTTEQRTVRRQNDKRNNGRYRYVPAGAPAPVYSATAFNRGKTPGLIFDGMCHMRLDALALPAGGKIHATVSYESPAQGSFTYSGRILGLCSSARPPIHVDYEDTDSAVLLYGTTNQSELNFVSSRAGMGYSPSVLTTFETFYRLSAEYSGTGASLAFNGALLSPTSPFTADFAAVVDVGFFCSPNSPNLSGTPRGSGVEQAVVILYEPPTSTQRAQNDAILVATAGGLEYAVPLDATPDTTGSMSAGQATLTVLDATGYDIGKTVIVNPSGGYLTHGPGGTWPALTGTDESAILALTSSTPGNFIRALDTGKVYAAKTNGSGYEVWNFQPNWLDSRCTSYNNRAYPLPLVAKIIGKSGNELTLDAPAQNAVSGVVCIDNWPIIAKYMTATEGATRNFPAGSFWMSRGFNLFDQVRPSLIGAVGSGGRAGTIFKKPLWLQNDFFELTNCRWPTVLNIKVVGNHRGKDGLGLGRGANGSQGDVDTGARGIYISGGSNPLVANCEWEDMPQRGIYINGSGDTGRPYELGTTPFTTEDGRRLGGLAKNCRGYGNYPHHTYLQWQAGSTDGTVPIEFRDFSWTSSILTKAFEFFRTTNGIWTRPRLLNGCMSSNSNKLHEIIDLDVTWTHACRVLPGEPQAGPYFGPIALDGYMLNINFNAGAAASTSGYLRVKRLIQEGWTDSAGNVFTALNDFNCPDWTIEGDYNPLVADDGQRRGLIIAPPHKSGSNGSDRVGANVNNKGNMTIRKLRVVPALGMPGAASYPTQGKDIALYGEGTGGSSLTDTITGTDTVQAVLTRSPGATGSTTFSGNVSNDNYLALGATGLLNDITLPPAKVGVAYIGFIRGKRPGSTVTISGPGSAGLSVALSGAGWYVVGTPTSTGDIFPTEALPGCPTKTSPSAVAVAAA